ncbi:ABC transporter ATP-binding protein [Wenjunlia tyrosinilytica]|uniref:ABC transporter domain-containing protein n=1 Tax=Wenjunlia tyrosinilytica TaxID=1544741 RepID=A0A917ZF39_9ACTN|nr:ATP-binding cassette domain-containing protein [Wenjunlia tyrosinilytica]GGO81835.1 hypothetical protein GCM10012280_07050 [Wenjunlia tyrosinilytica]
MDSTPETPATPEKPPATPAPTPGTPTIASVPPAPTREGAALSVDGLRMRGPRGPVYGDVRFEAGPGSLVAIEGPSGSGRTCLLLTLAGRMRPTSGKLLVDGLPLPQHMAAVRRFTALGPVEGVNDLDPALTAAEHIHERVLLLRRFDGALPDLFRPRRGRRAADEERRTHEALELAGLRAEDLPRGLDTHVRQLSALQVLRLGTAMALIGRPRLLCVDDADRGLGSGERAEAWRMLRAVAAAGTTAVATCSQAPEVPQGPEGPRGPEDNGAVTVRLEPPHTPGRPGHPHGTDDTDDTEKEEAADALVQAGRP